MSPPDRHIEVVALAPGVWAALQAPGGWLVGNAGIVDLGGRTILFDSGLTPQAGEALRDACRKLTGRPPELVLLSHYHNDHARGVTALPDAVLIATAGTRERLDRDGRAELAADRDVSAARLADARELDGSDDPLLRSAARLLVPYWEALVATAPRLELRLPDLAVDGELRLHGAARRALLRPLGGGHSGDDAVLLLPDDGIAFCGDLLFVATHPFLADGDPAAARAALDDLERSGARTFVPGHGPVADRAALDAMRAYLDEVTELAGSVARGAVAVDAVAVPVAYRGWDLAHPFFRANLDFLVRR